LFPGGIGDVYDEHRGAIKDLQGPVHCLKSWARHLLHYVDGRFSHDQLFTLYLYNTIQRQDNNSKGSYFFKSNAFFGNNPPTVEDLKEQIRHGNFSFISKLRYFSQTISGSDGFWRKKQNELKSWIDFHVSRQHGPPTHFITLTCAENWWPDLREIMIDLEKKSEQNRVSGTTFGVGDINETTTDHKKKTPSQSFLLETCDFKAMGRAARKYPLYVNKFFMHRAKKFMDEYARDVMDLEYYWGRVEFAAGRGQIHLHILGIAKNKAYLKDFYDANTEEEKTKVLYDYATKHLDMTADVEIDENHQKLDPQNKRTTSSPLGRRFSEAPDIDMDHRHLAQDCMCHDCNNYCLGEEDSLKIKLRCCRFGFGTEKTSNMCDTEGKEFQREASIFKDHKGVEHLLLPRLRSRRTVQHSRSLLQAWRANADVQLLIYRSNPDIPDVSEIEAVSRYCVAYAGKRYKTTRQEKDAIQDIILR